METAEHPGFKLNANYQSAGVVGEVTIRAKSESSISVFYKDNFNISTQ